MVLMRKQKQKRRQRLKLRLTMTSRMQQEGTIKLHTISELLFI